MAGTSKYSWRIRQALDYLKSAYERPHLTLARAGAHVGLSGKRLGLLFKKEMGLTFRSFLRARRMERACELLRDSPLSVKEIAAKIGYTAASNFEHDFRSAFGLTPSEYRKRAE